MRTRSTACRWRRLRSRPDEVRVAVEAAGLNFWDVFAALRLIDDKLLGTEMCGRIIEVGSAVSSVAVGDRVVGVRRGDSGALRAGDRHP